MHQGTLVKSDLIHHWLSGKCSQIHLFHENSELSIRLYWVILAAHHIALDRNSVQ